MEFYEILSVAIPAIVFVGFQFPTGWNSTISCVCRHLSKPGFQFPTGWNSTLVALGPLNVLRVSIPNGMEFYSNAITKEQAKTESFNSQRDGILHFIFLFAIQYIMFQFPTGWNSTETSAGQKNAIARFNSQRDGILPQHHLKFKQSYGVSIPNGMEFYPAK